MDNSGKSFRFSIQRMDETGVESTNEGQIHIIRKLSDFKMGVKTIKKHVFEVNILLV